MVAGFVCVAIAILEPKFLDAITDFRKWAIGGAVVAFTCMGCITYGFKNGMSDVQGRWDAALARELELGEKARSAAERDLPDTADRGMFRGDPFNRDSGRLAPESRGPLRRMASNHLFGR